MLPQLSAADLERFPETVLGFDAGRVVSFIERNKDFLHLKALLGKT
jgi:hypothetical protein